MLGRGTTKLGQVGDAQMRILLKKAVKSSIIGILIGMSIFLIVNILLILAVPISLEPIPVFGVMKVLKELLKAVVILGLFGGTLGFVVGLVINITDLTLAKRLFYSTLAGIAYGMLVSVIYFKGLELGLVVLCIVIALLIAMLAKR